MLPHSGPPLQFWRHQLAASQQLVLDRAAAAASASSNLAPGLAPARHAAQAAPYALSETQLTRAPGWALPHAERLRADLGSTPTAHTAIKLSITGLASSTVASYSGLWGQFVEFCGRQQRPCSPASPATVVLYIAHLHDRGGVSPHSLQPYLSAINRYHRDALGIDPGPAVGPDITNVVRGWKQECADGIGDVTPVDQRVALPASVAMRALQAAAAMPRLDTYKQCQEYRSLMYTGLGFALMARSDTDAHLLLDDVGITDTDAWFRLRAEKGTRTRRVRRILRIPKSAANGLLHGVISRWISGQRLLHNNPLFGASFRAQQNFWRLPGDASVWSSSSTICTQWLSHATDLLGCSAPPGFKWTSHSLRKGAATAANAIGASLHTICYHGGWSVKSGVVHDYIDPSIVADSAAAAFFAWLLPRTISSTWASESAAT